MGDPSDKNLSEGDNENANAEKGLNSNEQDNGKANETDFEKLYRETKETLANLESTNSRLLEESKRHKTQKEKVQEDLLIEQGKKDELIQSLRERIQTHSQKEEQQNIAAAIAAEAEKRNCEDWDFVYNLADTSMISHDPETGVVSGVKAFFDEAQKNKRYTKFFTSAEVIKADDSIPGFTPPKGPDTIDYRKFPLDYLKACTAISPEKRKEAINKLSKEGLIK